MKPDATGAATAAARDDLPRPTRSIIRAIPPAVELRAEEGEDTRPTLFGYFSRFNQWTEINSYFEGRFMERIAFGAYKKTFKDRANEIRVLFQHGRDPQVGDKPIAEIEELREDADGAYYEARLLDGVPDLIVAGLRAGQYGQSFKMEILREEWVEEPEVSDDNPAGLPERTIKEIRLFEFGPVTFPAYANTEAGLRSMTDEFVFDWLARQPERARDLMRGAHDLSLATDRVAASQDADAARKRTSADDQTDRQNAPSEDDAALSRTSAQERRDPDKGRYGLTPTDPRPSWAL